MKIGFIGLGNMGRGMAGNLQKAGHQLIVNDVRKDAAKPFIDKGATWADSPGEAARSATVIMTSLPGPAEVEAVVLGENGVLAGAAKGSVYVDLSTVSPTTARRIGAAAKEKGVDMLGAPVTGSPYGAEAATLTIMVGGDAAVLEKVRPLLQAMSKRVVHMGDIGAGNAMKLVNNHYAFIQAHGLAETMAVAAKAGLDLQKVYEVLSTGLMASGTLTMHYPKFGFAGNFDSTGGMPISLAYKDMRLISDTARDLGVPLHMGSVIMQQLVEEMALGWGNKETTSILLRYEELLGVKIRVKV